MFFKNYGLPTQEQYWYWDFSIEAKKEIKLFHSRLLSDLKSSLSNSLNWAINCKVWPTGWNGYLIVWCYGLTVALRSRDYGVEPHKNFPAFLLLHETKFNTLCIFILWKMCFGQIRQFLFFIGVMCITKHSQCRTNSTMLGNILGMGRNNWYDLSNHTFVMYGKGSNGSCVSSSLDLFDGLDSQWRTNNTEIASECLTVYLPIQKSHLTALPNGETALRLRRNLGRNVWEMICNTSFLSIQFSRGRFQIRSENHQYWDYFISQKTKMEWINVYFILFSKVNLEFWEPV